MTRQENYSILMNCVKNTANISSKISSSSIVIGPKRYVVYVAYLAGIMHSTSLQKATGLFAGPLIIRTFTTYFSSIEGAAKVPNLSDVHTYPYAALGMAVSSVSTFLIW